MNEDAKSDDLVEFDDLIARALADSASGPAPGAHVKRQLMARLSQAVPAGFSLQLAAEEDWLPYPIPGIRMRVLAMNKRTGYATLLLDVAPGVHFPPHHHGGDEECYVISGDVHTLGRRLGPGDFLHADEGTYHPEMWTDGGARVILVVPSEEVPT